jgi:hypothetical protein
MDTIFVPITCIGCRRHSAMSFSKRDVKRKLDAGEPIALHCSYDDVTWDAASRERLEIMKFVMEAEVVSRIAMVREPIDRSRAAIA